MRFHFRTALTLAAAWCAFVPPAQAQDAFDAPPHLSMVQGGVTLDREDATEPATIGVPIVPGDRVRTERGRAELIFPDGSALDLDEFSTIELEAPTLLRMTSGRLLLFAAGSNNPSSAVQFQIDTPVASAQTDGPGKYRVSILGNPSAAQTEMAVVRGAGALVTEVGSVALRSGERSTAWDNGAPSSPQSFNSARSDGFDQWASGLRDQRLGSQSQSAQYLPADLRVYGGDLDRYGSWNYETTYGYVWYPTVASEWQPYYDGYWAPLPGYGWTWVGVDTWSWPTHHYGRWGYARNRWFWIPDRRWSPAWVSWGGAPGYVSWSPLGFDNRPVFALSVSGAGYRGLNGWTVVPRERFVPHGSVRQFAVAPRALPANVTFVAQASAPVAPPHAVPRRSVVNGGQTAVARRTFPNVVKRSGDGAVTPAAPPPTSVRSPQPVSRQPQTTQGSAQGNGQPAQNGQQGQQPRTEQGGSGDRARAVSRQPQAPAGQTAQPSQPASSQKPKDSDKPSNDGHRRNTARTKQPDANGAAPQNQKSLSNSGRPIYQRPIQRGEPIRPVQPAQPDGGRHPRFHEAVLHRFIQSVRPPRRRLPGRSVTSTQLRHQWSDRSLARNGRTTWRSHKATNAHKRLPTNRGAVRQTEKAIGGSNP